MKPAEKIERLIKKSRYKASPEVYDKAFGSFLQAVDAYEKQKSAIAQPNIWRIIMKSKMTKLAVAAVIIIACVTGMFFWKSTGSGIALADVLTRIEQVTRYMYQMSSTITRKQTTSKWTSNILISQDHGIKITEKRIDPQNGESQSEETYILPQQNSMVFIGHKEKSYVRLKFDDDTELESYKEENNDPRIIIQQILSCSHTSLGQSVIDGVTVEGFQTTDPAYNGGFAGVSDFMGKAEKVDVKLWVDVRTFLPVRLEEDIVTKKGTRMHEVSYDFRWNVVVNADDFEPDIPEDYTAPTGELIIPAFDEENAIKGLRLFADLTGDYPDNLNKDPLSEEAKKLTGSDTSSWKDIPDNEKNRRTNDISIPIFGLGVFYETLVEDKKDPAYYGETVRPDDTDKVLLRWKLDDGQYRVIFGDLSIKNVTPEELAELEKP